MVVGEQISSQQQRCCPCADAQKRVVAAVRVLRCGAPPGSRRAGAGATAPMQPLGAQLTLPATLPATSPHHCGPERSAGQAAAPRCSAT